MLGKIMEAKEKMAEAKRRLETISVVGEAEGGAVKVTATASRKLQQIEISETLWQQQDKEQVEELVLVAVNRALEQADKVSEAEMQSIAKDMLPGMGGLGSLFGK